MLERVVETRSYRNIKTGNIYSVLAIAKHSENPSELFVCYTKNGDSWIRPLELFKEKFEEVDANQGN